MPQMRAARIQIGVQDVCDEQSMVRIVYPLANIAGSRSQSAWEKQVTVRGSVEIEWRALIVFAAGDCAAVESNACLIVIEHRETEFASLDD